MTVEEAREKGVCRICGANVRIAGSPLGWETEFGERIHPPPVLVLNFGDEFAHQHCLEIVNAAASAEGPEQQQAAAEGRNAARSEGGSMGEGPPRHGT